MKQHNHEATGSMKLTSVVNMINEHENDNTRPTTMSNRTN